MMDRELQYLIAKNLKSCIKDLESKRGPSDVPEKDAVISLIAGWFEKNQDSRVYTDKERDGLKQYLDACLKDWDEDCQSDKTCITYEYIISWFSKHTMWMEMKIKKIEGEKKIFHDPIHGSIELDPLLVAIIDTKQFQRLRNLHQLGGNSRVYPSAKHSRFEHSIGVCHLAGKVARRLRENQGGLNITDKDILCVQIAGLCHDLGHGPFSHLFEKVLKGMGKKIHHEKLSCDLFDQILKENPHIRENLTPKEILFIKEQINTDLKQTYDIENKKFLYEIVANKRNGVDVDKWDYLVRDHYFLGMPHAFDYHVVNFLRALKVPTGPDGKEEYMICARDIKKESLYAMFQARQRLHRVVLFHRVTKAVEHMICDALLEASKELKYGGKAMAECVDDCDDYIKLTDAVYYDILNQEESHENPGLKKAKAILQRIEERDLYPTILYADFTLELNDDQESTAVVKKKKRKATV